MSDKPIDLYATAHPRSGQTWLLRMLSHVLDATLDGDQYWGEGQPEGIYNVNKSHSVLKFGPTVFIYRDPRDVVMSIWHYRSGYQSIREVIESLSLPIQDSAIDRYGSYLDFVLSWYKTGRAEVEVKYENLHFDAIRQLGRICKKLTGYAPSGTKLGAAVFDHEFGHVKAKYAPNLDHSMWLGKVGTWREYFTQVEADLCQAHWGNLMLDQGYIDSPNWVHDVRMKA